MKRNRSNSESTTVQARPSVIGFRLDEESWQRLAERARARNVTVQQYARYLVIDSLHAGEQAARDWTRLAEATEALVQCWRDKCARCNQCGGNRE